MPDTSNSTEKRKERTAVSAGRKNERRYCVPIRDRYPLIKKRKKKWKKKEKQKNVSNS